MKNHHTFTHKYMIACRWDTPISSRGTLRETAPGARVACGTPQAKPKGN